ncbi:unnamed protein product [Pleuronectes platessa]|uniref:Uncharacterized protein n=1 Tax=Pleuronectes platessa TaxID=8262 RepID=A0A9N7YZP7_PLEPL|nr:unnamed protein product [Pleuronectes platessa]
MLVYGLKQAHSSSQTLGGAHLTPDLPAVPQNAATPPALSDAIEAHCQRSAPGQGGVAAHSDMMGAFSWSHHGPLFEESTERVEGRGRRGGERERGKRLPDLRTENNFSLAGTSLITAPPFVCQRAAELHRCSTQALRGSVSAQC